ncbi:hypothetical protein OAV88_01680 [bacterium]|nr:hypothetical protein [bacterium]
MCVCKNNKIKVVRKLVSLSLSLPLSVYSYILMMHITHSSSSRRENKK